MKMNSDKSTKCIVTGGAGFIGSHFVDYIIDKSIETIVIDDLSYGKKENINPEADFIHLDILDFKRLNSLIQSVNPDYIVHFAANATTKSSALGWNNPFKDYKINMVGTLNILESLRMNQMKTHFLYASSAAVYGEPEYTPIDEYHVTMPISPYGISKLAGEKYCWAYYREFQIQSTVMRIFNTYGPRQPRYVIYDQLSQMMRKNAEIHVLGTGEQIRDYIYVEDTVKAFYEAMLNKSSSGKIYNLAGGNQISIKNLIHALQESLGIHQKVVYTGQSWKGDISKLWADTKKIKNELNWKPVQLLKEGVENMIYWMNANEKK